MCVIEQLGRTQGQTMRAAVCTAYGPPGVVLVRGVERPAIGDRDVLVRIAAASVSAADWRLRARAMPRGFGLISRIAIGLKRPRRAILGSEFSGTVTAIGKAVTRFKVGDAVAGYPGIGLGCHAEFRAMPEDGALVPKPASLSHLEAAALFFGGTAALYFLRDKGRVREGNRVLVIGASGSVGSAAVQLARHMGAEVTGVCSGDNCDLVAGLGAHTVIDYTREDYTRQGPRYDVILDTIGVEEMTRARRALAPDGKFLMVAAGVPQMLMSLTTLWRRQKAIFGLAPERREDVEYLAALAARGIYRPVVDQVFSMDDIAAAHARVESRRKRGNTVLRIADCN
jgi:NADPH:quinone reductase-like Zn-dependent oxidoreductase